MRYLALLLPLVLLFSCKSDNELTYREAVREICLSEEDRKVLSDFVLNCIKNGNNMSDEEMEDVVRECRLTGESILCPNTKVVEAKHGNTGYWRIMGTMEEHGHLLRERRTK